MAITPFNDIQGHQFWYQSKAHIQWRREGVCRMGQTSLLSPPPAIDILMVTTMALSVDCEQYAKLGFNYLSHSYSI